VNSEELCYIVETAPSFEQISQSITGLLADSTADESEAVESCDEVFNTATLSAEYQQISTWCWVNIRVCYFYFYTVFPVGHSKKLKLVFCLKAHLRNSTQSCHFLSRPEPFTIWLASVFLTNSSYIAVSEIQTGNLWIASPPWQLSCGSLFSKNVGVSSWFGFYRFSGVRERQTFTVIFRRLGNVSNDYSRRICSTEAAAPSDILAF